MESIPGRADVGLDSRPRHIAFGSCIEDPPWLTLTVDRSGWFWMEQEVEAPSQADVDAESPFD